MSKNNKEYQCKWPEAVDKGWDGYVHEDRNGNLISKGSIVNGRDAIGDFVEKQMPKLYDDFYQLIIDEMEKAGIDNDTAVEWAEELLGPNLGESLAWFAGWARPKLLKEYK